MKKTRVLIYGAGTKVGGIEEFLLNLYRHMDHDSIALDLIPHGGPNFYAESEWRDMGGEIYPVFDERQRLSNRKLNEVLRRERSRHQVMYFNVCALYRIAPFLAARQYGYPFIVHSHNTEDHSRGIVPNMVHRLNRIPVRYWANSCLACSSSAGEWLFGEKFFHTNSKCSVIRNAIDLNVHAFSSRGRNHIRSKYHLSSEENVYITVGRLTGQKNQQFSIQVFSEIVKKQPHSTLFLVGEGSDIEPLQQMTMRMGLQDKVIFTGVRSDISDFMSAADLMLFPSIYEGLGIVAIESQACGLPILASDKVPDEAMVIDSLMKKKSLEDSASQWAQQAISMIECQNSRQLSHMEELAEAGYSITDLAKSMQRLFMQYGEEKK